MQLIKSLRSFCRWLFNIKYKSKPNPLPDCSADDIFCHVAAPYIKVVVLKVDGNFVSYRHYGYVPTHRLLHKDFHFHYRKIS